MNWYAVVLQDSTDTLTNKTITNAAINATGIINLTSQENKIRFNYNAQVTFLHLQRITKECLLMIMMVINHMLQIRQVG